MQLNVGGEPKTYPGSYSTDAVMSKRPSFSCVIYHTRRKKLKYRGKFRVQLWAICRAAWINMSRIANYLANQAEASA